MLKKLAVTAVAVVAALVAVLSVQTARFASKQVSAPPADLVAVDPAPAAERLAGALRFQTVSYQDPSRFSPEAFLGLRAHLERSFPRVHAALSRETISGYSLLYTWPGRDASLPPLLLLAHMDVVPVEPGTEAAWTHPPFEGRIADGIVWGRGAWDDKSSVVGLLEACEALLAAGFQPERTVLLAFGHDEEVSGTAGAQRIAALLAERGVRPECVLDEGAMVVSDGFAGVAPVALVGIAEKGYAVVDLTVRAEGGHSSMPPPQTAIGVLSAAVARLEASPMPARLDGPVRQMLEYIGPETALGQRVVFANMWLTAPLVERRMASEPATNAFLRTTTAVTIVEGGTKENVLPGQARAVVNFRLRPGDTIDDVVAHVRAAVDDPRVEVAARPGANPASPVSDVAAPAFARIQTTIRQVYPDAVVAPYLVVGATDGRHYAGLTPNVYRFLPIAVPKPELSKFHGTNESISVENYVRCVQFYAQFIRNS
jgi:carboxypeptidase PM20D1